MRSEYGAVLFLLVAACAAASHVEQPAPSAHPSGPNVATYQGCPVFTARDAFNVDVSGAAVDPSSDTYVASLVSGGDAGGFEAAHGSEKINLADNTTPLVTVKPVVAWHSFPNPYPWRPSYFIEPAPSDQHAMVLQTQTCHLYESYQTVYADGALSAYSGADWDLRRPYAQGSATGASANAAGTPFFAGMIKWEEYRAGSINHALNFAPSIGSIAEHGHVSPAFNNAESRYVGSVSPQIPYGARLRLKASFDISNFPPQARAIAQAMKTYGIIITDTGGTCCPNQLYLANALDGSDPWDSSDLSALGNVHITDFEVLKLPASP